MSTEVTLLLLRFVSAAFLLLILTGIFIVLWKDYRFMAVRTDRQSHTHGQVIVFEVVNGQQVATGESYPLRSLTSLGRSSLNTIIVDDSFASGEHARIVLRDGHWWLEDQDSRNGTMLNGNIIKQAVIVTSGDMIGIGEKLFRFDLE